MKTIFSKHFLLSMISIVCYAFILSYPMWNFKFKAPQYPDGLELQVYMTGTKGDVFEIDIINHYIGMQKLELAAQNERAIAPYVIALLAIFSLLLAILPKNKFARFLSLANIGFPIAFVAVFYLWLYKFGHDLNPAAPVDLAPFTPTILGTGIIGQFTTFAYPGPGFYLALIPAVISLVIAFKRKTPKS